MGLSVETDGAAASAEIVARGLNNDLPLSVGVMSKVLIDIWIGVIAFVPALIWVFIVETRRAAVEQKAAVATKANPSHNPGVDRRRPSPLELWFRFPKFVIGYFFTSLVVSLLVIHLAGTVYASQQNPVDAASKAVMPVVGRGTDPFRVLLFGLTYVAIGINTRFSLMKQYRLWNLFVAYGVALLIIIGLAYLISTSLFPK